MSDATIAFASVTSRGLPGVLIKIMSGCSHMLILGAIKMMPTPLHAHGRWGKGVPSFVFYCVGGMCVMLCVDEHVCLRVHVCVRGMQQLLGRRQGFKGGS